MDKRIILMVGVVLLLPSFGAPADPLVFGVLENLPPYEYLENGQLKGIDIEIGEYLSRRIGTEIRYKALPWARMRKSAEEGEIDGILSMYCLDRYLEVLDFAESPITAEISFFSLKESDMTVSGIDSLKGKSVGVIRGYTYTPEFAECKDVRRDQCVG